MEQGNINQVEIIPEVPSFDDTPITNNVSPEIQRLGGTIRNRANSSLLGANKNLYGTDLNNLTAIGKSNKISLNKFDVGRDAYVETNSGELIGRFEKFIPGINNEELLAKQQTNGEKWSNGLVKFLGKTGVNVLGGTIGTIEGLINGVRMQSLSSIYNSDFNKYLDDLNTKMDYKLPNYYTEQEKNMNFGQKLGTANFWANDFLGGVSFLTGTIISEGLWAAATGGTSLLTTGGRLALRASSTGRQALKTLNAVKQPGKQILRAGTKTSVEDLVKGGIKAQNLVQGLQTARFLYTSAGFEAGVEARHFMKEATAEWEQMFREQNGRTPTAEERAAFKNSVENSGNGLFAANVGLVGTSNLTILGRMFLNKAPSKAISNSMFKKTFLGLGYKKTKDGGIKAITANKYQKAFGRAYAFGKPAITEGVIEEGGQAVLSTAATEYTLSAYDKNNVEDNLSLIESLQKGFGYAYGTKEGLTEVGLGTLIGVLGGGFSSRFRYNDVSNERKQIEESVKYVNDFTRDNLIENLKFGAKMRKSTIDSEKAKREGNLTNEMRADMAAMTAVAERAYHFENKDETIKDFYSAIDSMDDSTLKDEYGFSEQEVAEWKMDKKAQFKDVVDTHTRNLQFAEGIVGSTPIAGINEIQGLDASGVADLKGAIAFTLTMGTKSDEFTESLANQIKLTLARDLITGEDLDAVSVNEVLRKVSDKKTKQYNTKAKKVAQLEAKLDRLTKAKIEADNIVQLSDKENNKAARAKVVKVQEEILAVQEALGQLQLEKTAAFEALKIPQLTDEIITEDMLDNQAEAISKLSETIDTISQSDPQRGELLKNLYLEYDRAIDNTKRFNELVRGVIDPKIRVSTLSGWAGKIINRKKSVNGDTAQLFINMVNTYQEKNQGRNEVVSDAVNEAVNEGVNEGVNQDPLSVEPEDITVDTPTENVGGPIINPMTVIQNLKNKVQDMVKRDPYTSLEYRGEEFNFDDVAPKQFELDRYNELLSKVKPGRRISNLLQNPFNKNNPGGLTKSETEELQRLNEKLNNWKILSGFTNDNNDSVAEMLQLIKQLEGEYQQAPTKVKVEAREIPTSEKAKSGVSKDALSTIVTVDIPVAKKLGNTNKYEISHLEPTSLLRLFPNSKLYVLIKGKNVDTAGVPSNKLQELQKTPGTQFILTTENGEDIAFSLKERQRLEVDIEDLESQLPSSNVRILDFGNSSFMPLFVKNGEEFVPLQGDFGIQSVNKNEVITLDSQALYDLKPQSRDGNTIGLGDNLRTVVNLNDTFNDKLIKDFKNGKITEEELVNNIHIYLSPQGSANKIVGSVRAILPSSNANSETFSKLHILRKQAVRKALNSPSKRVEVGVTIPLRMVLVGSPNMSVTEENGKVIPVNKNLSQEAYDMIDDYGYVMNGKVFTNRNLEYSEKDTIFATSVSNREENKNKKIPVISFKFKGRTIVYPVSLTERQGTKGTTAYGILNNPEKSDVAKIIELNDLLIDSNINPKKYAIYDLNSEQSISEVNRMISDLNQLPDVADVESWLRQDHNKNELLNSIQLGIDITNKPFNAPKGILDFQGIQMPDENSMEIESVNTLDNLAKKVNSIFGQNNPFAEMTDNWKFYDAFEEEGIDRNAETYIMKKRNANILRNAFDQPIPKTVRSVLGDDLINQIRAELNQYKLLTQGSKLNTKVIEGELKDELSEIENNCK